jgi:hypothetical protein
MGNVHFLPFASDASPDTKRRARKARNQARWRHNADSGAMVCPVLVTRDLLDWLIDDIHWVPEVLCGDRLLLHACCRQDWLKVLM